VTTSQLREQVTVAICTFRRPSLAATLRSIAEQSLPKGRPLRVIVADNDDHDKCRSGIEQMGKDLGLDLHYVHAPARNISVARNACLDACPTPWMAFIDDDEMADPEWLTGLFEEKATSQFIFGPCQAVYPPEAPKWMVEADIHSNRMTANDGAWNGYTSNVLMDVGFIRTNRLRFSHKLGQTGGEDTFFFFSANELSATFSYNNQAKVLEPVSPSRLTFSWAARRRFRAGQIHHMLLSRQKSAWQGELAAIGKALFCLVIAPAYGARWREPILRSMLHAGVVARAIGTPIYAEYATTQAGPTSTV